VVYQRALSLLGATDLALIDSAIDALAAGDGAALFGAVESVMDAGHDPRRFATDLLERFRDLIVLQVVPDAAVRGVVDAPDDVMDRMREQAAQIGIATLTRYAEVVHAGLGEMRGATAPRLLLEVVCARLLLPSASDTESALLQRIERIETRMNVSIPASESGGVSGTDAALVNKQFIRKSQSPQQDSTQGPPASTAPPQPAAVEPAAPPAESVAVPEPAQVAPQAPAPAPVVQAPAPAPPPVQRPASRPAPAQPAPPAPEPEPAAAEPTAPAPAAVGGQPDAAAVRAMWSSVREKVRARSRSLEAMLMEATVRSVDDDTLLLAHPSAPLAKRLSEQHNTEVIREALKDALGVNWRVRCDAGAAPAGAAPAPQRGPSPAEQQAAEEQRVAAERAEEEDMLADAARDVGQNIPRRDPEEAALELLKTELGARPIGE